MSVLANEFIKIVLIEILLVQCTAHTAVTPFWRLPGKFI
jgi:hypothetical protein